MASSVLRPLVSWPRSVGTAAGAAFTIDLS